MYGTKRPPLNEQKSLWEATVAAEGVTTAPGAADGKSIVDSTLALSGANSFFSMLMVLYPGQPKLVDSMDITGFTDGTGEVIFSTAYKGIAAAIPAGVPYKIVTFRFVPAEVAALVASLGLMADAATADDLSDVTTTSAQAKLRRLLLRFSTNAFSANVNPGAAAATDVETMIQDLANVLAGATGIVTFPAAAVPADGVSFAEVLRQIYNDVIAIAAAGALHEQADVPFNVNAVLIAEANIFDLSAVNTRYVVRSLRLKCVDPGAETVTVRLYELVNNVQTLVDTFAITTANFATAHSLTDMFGLFQLAGDNLKVTVIATAAGPFACTGQYCTATATI